MYREGAVPLRCWAQGSGSDSMRGRRGRREERGGGIEGLKGGVGIRGEEGLQRKWS